jgi:hypothetical protein
MNMRLQVDLYNVDDRSYADLDYIDMLMFVLCANSQLVVLWFRAGMTTSLVPSPNFITRTKRAAHYHQHHHQCQYVLRHLSTPVLIVKAPHRNPVSLASG